MQLFNKRKLNISTNTKKKYLSFLNNSDGILCKAPFTSLYFHSDGRIGPCCIYNPCLSFGNYPQTSLEQILVSKHREKLQQYIKKSRFDFGCTLCGQSIESGNFEGAISTQYKNFGINNKYPEKLEFELSDFCNLNCIMCGSHNNIKESFLYNTDQFYSEILPFITNASQCSFYGGEPFLIESYYKIWDLITEKNKDCLVYIQTNGTINNNRVINVIENLNLNLGVSLDAISENLFQSIRKGAKLSNVLENITIFNKIVRSKNSYLSISITPIPSNLIEMIDIYNYCNSIHSKIFFNTVHFPRQFSIFRLSSAELFEWHNYMTKNNYHDYNNPNFENNQKQLQSLIDMILHYANKNKEIEELGKPEKLSEVISKIAKQIIDKEYSFKFQEIYKNYNQNMLLSPILVADIFSFDKNLFNETIIDNLKLNNISNIRKIIGINE